MEIKIYKTFMRGVKIHCDGELVASVPYTKNGVKFIDEISNLTATTVINNVRHGDIPESRESSLHLHSGSVSVCPTCNIEHNGGDKHCNDCINKDYD